jgi:hypothetical protein
MMTDWAKLLEIVGDEATPTERRIAEHRAQGYTIVQTAKLLGVDKRNIERPSANLVKRAALRGYSPDADAHGLAPDGYLVKGKSTFYNEDGVPIRTWVKTDVIREHLSEMLKAYVDGLCENITPAKSKPVPKFLKHSSDLLTGIFIGDAHVGMRAFGIETKHSNFDTDIAVEQLRDAIDYLVEKAEPTETGLLVDVGDFVHANTQHGTTYGGTPLDVDTRHYRVMKAAAEVMQYMTDRMLEKFKKVVIVVARGNHNTDAAGAVQLMLEFYYHKEPRVHVLPTDGFYHYIEYGKWLLGIHHGDKQKPESLASSMARDMPEAWGRTTHRMWCTGHFHKEAVRTLPGVKHKVFAALPPPDSWHASHGYAGDGEMEMLTFRREGGLYSSHVYNIPQPRQEPDVRLA